MTNGKCSGRYRFLFCIEMSLVNKIRRAVRGEVSPTAIALELVRRSRASLQRQHERATLDQVGKRGVRLRPQFERMTPSALLDHFRLRQAPRFLPGFLAKLSDLSNLQRTRFPAETTKLILLADRIVDEHSWPILGFGEKAMGAEIDWHRDPLSGAIWPLQYHADLQLFRGDGSDARVLWELNRLPHLIPLALAYAVTGDERYSKEFFQQLRSWRSQNPFGLGINWNCAMEVALRAMNLLGCFEMFRHSEELDAGLLSELLTILDQHGEFIRSNLEFSYLATSNHYLSDVVGLLWLGLMLPELEAAAGWRDFGLRETLREMDKQINDDGSDFEASTGYHRFVLELFLYSFLLCRANGVEIKERYWRKLYSMLDYMCAYLRPDGKAPIIGDSDSGQVLPIRRRGADDQAYVLAIGAAVFDEPRFRPAGGDTPEELAWILGEEGVIRFQGLVPAEARAEVRRFPDAGIYVLREDDLYLLFNASDSGMGGRGSHGHNDALSIEVSACGRPFIIDPGTYVYTADLHERQLFRSTAYHSTVQIENVEQNTTIEQFPFVIGNEARPHHGPWKIESEWEVSAEHHGYCRLPQPITHRRKVRFNKQERWWLIEDEFLGEGNHELVTRFHFDSGLNVSVSDDFIVKAVDETSDARILVCPLSLDQEPELISQFTSRDYGSKTPSVAACWSFPAEAPCVYRWALVPACASEKDDERLRTIRASMNGSQVPD